MNEKRKALRLACAAACFALCCAAGWFSARAGLSRLLTESAPALRFAGMEPQATHLAAEAARLSPLDPEARRELALALAANGDARGAVEAAEGAVRVQPRYYLSWLRLGRARAQAGDSEGAAAAYREAVRLAPTYADARWQLGNMLLREGRTDEAFVELRAAAFSRPALLAYTAELAWHARGGDARAVAASVAPETPAARAALARLFARRGQAAAAVEQFSAGAREAGEGERRALVAELIAAGAFREAHAVWAEGGGEEAGPLADGGFEGRAAAPPGGFGWQFARDVAGASPSLDVTGPRAGARSLLLEFDGAADANARLAAQLVVVETGARYRLTFAARTAGLVSGGPPAVFVLEAADGARPLAASAPLPRDSDWEAYELEFEATAEAVRVVVGRHPCAAAPCPIFGRAWLDEFSLRKIN